MKRARARRGRDARRCARRPRARRPTRPWRRRPRRGSSARRRSRCSRCPCRCRARGRRGAARTTARNRARSPRRAASAARARARRRKPQTGEPRLAEEIGERLASTPLFARRARAPRARPRAQAARANRDRRASPAHAAAARTPRRSRCRCRDRKRASCATKKSASAASALFAVVCAEQPPLELIPRHARASYSRAARRGRRSTLCDNRAHAGRNAGILVVVLVVLVAAMFMVPRAPSPTPLATVLAEPRRSAVRRARGHSTARASTSTRFRGRFTLLFFGFTHCPDVCPLTLKALADVRATASTTRASRYAAGRLRERRPEPRHARARSRNISSNFDT